MTDQAVQLTEVWKRYPHFVLEGISLALDHGQIMGFVGPNGAGKSTTLRILMGLLHQDRGEVRLLGHRMPDAQVAAKRDVGFVSEDMRLYGAATLQWHMDFVRSIYPSWDAAYAADLLRRFELKAEQRIKGLSHGQRVKAALLVTLARRPRLLVLDEPTTGLDPVARHEVLRELMAVLRDESRTILFSSHHTGDVEQISDRITFIDGGRIIESDDKERVLDRWRRVRLEVPAEASVPSLPGVLQLEREGRVAVATVDRFDDAIPRAYREAGATVHAVDPMTLEEIFLARVQARRAERAS